MKTLYLVTFLVALVLTGFSRSASAGKALPQANWPPVATLLSDNAPGPGSEMKITIHFQGSNSTSEPLTISATPGVFESIPSTVTLPANQTDITFDALIADNASGSFTVTATNLLGSASKTGHVTP